MPSKSEISGLRRDALLPDFHNGGFVDTTVARPVVNQGTPSGKSAAQELVEDRGMEGAVADEIVWGNNGQS